MTQLEVQEINDYLIQREQVILELVGKKDTNDKIDAHCLLRQSAAALYILHKFIPKERLVKAGLTTFPEGTFINPPRTNSEDHYKFQSRIIGLAEMIFNFQNVEGFKNLLKNFNDVEATMAALEGARNLFKADIRFRFVKEIGEIKKDYDVEIDYQGMTVPCEIKCKLQTTTFDENKIFAKLGDARSQLPNNKSSIILFKLPTSWVSEPNSRPLITDAVTDFFIASPQIAAVIFFWEEWSVETDAFVAQGLRYEIQKNENPHTKLDGFLDFLHSRLTSRRQNKWQYLQDIVCSPIAVYKRLNVTRGLHFTYLKSLFVGNDSDGILTNFQGDLADLVAAQNADIVTRIDFDCENFDLFLNVQKMAGADVQPFEIQTSEFSVFHGPTPSEFKFLIPGKIYDTGLIIKDGHTFLPEDRMRRMEEMVSQDNSLKLTDVDEDVLLLQLKKYFISLRATGGLLQPVYIIKNLAAFYLRLREDGQTWDTIFGVEYLGERIHYF